MVRAVRDGVRDSCLRRRQACREVMRVIIVSRDSITKILEYISIELTEEKLSSIEERIDPSRALRFQERP